MRYFSERIVDTTFFLQQAEGPEVRTLCLQLVGELVRECDPNMASLVALLEFYLREGACTSLSL